MSQRVPVMIDGVVFDALIDFERTLEAEIPDYPVESGFMVQDHIILKPMYLRMTLFLTNTPLHEQSSPGRIEQICDQLHAARIKRVPLSVVTPKGVYDEMAIENLSERYSVDLKSAMEIDITLKEIIITESKTTTIPDSYGKGGATGVYAGTANTSSLSEADNQRAHDALRTGNKKSIGRGITDNLGWT